MAEFTGLQVVSATLLCLLYLTFLSLYRIYLSPIAHIPGPLLAKLTYWYDFYYDVVQRGQYTFKIKQLHQEYGPILRVNPEEVHIADGDFYNVIYSRLGASALRGRGQEGQTPAFGSNYTLIS